MSQGSRAIVTHSLHAGLSDSEMRLPVASVPALMPACLQHDNHIPNLTVAETVNFAHTCHSGFDSPTFNLPGELCKAKVT